MQEYPLRAKELQDALAASVRRQHALPEARVEALTSSVVCLTLAIKEAFSEAGVNLITPERQGRYRAIADQLPEEVTLSQRKAVIRLLWECDKEWKVNTLEDVLTLISLQGAGRGGDSKLLLRVERILYAAVR